MSHASTESSLSKALEHAGVIVCAGTGGVGKTTLSASLALRAACMGRRTLVLTIDPARRLADALGIHTLSDEPAEIDLQAVKKGLRVTGGSLSAMMLDPNSASQSSSAAGVTPAMSTVVQLNDSNFDSTVINSDSVWMVAFISPACAHCQSLIRQP